MFAAFESYKNELEGIDGKTTESSSQSTNTTTNPTVSTMSLFDEAGNKNE